MLNCIEICSTFLGNLHPKLPHVLAHNPAHDSERENGVINVALLGIIRLWYTRDHISIREIARAYFSNGGTLVRRGGHFQFGQAGHKGFSNFSFVIFWLIEHETQRVWNGSRPGHTGEHHEQPLHLMTGKSCRWHMQL